MRSRCKYWDILHPVFAERTSSCPLFATDNLGNEDIARDLIRKRNEDEETEDNNSDNNSNIEIIDNTAGSSLTISALKGKRPIIFEEHKLPKKKAKISMAEIFLERNKESNELKKETLSFSMKKWEDEMEERQKDREEAKEKWKKEIEEKQKQLKIEEEQKKRDYEVEIMRAKSEKAIAKCNLIKSLSNLGLSQKEILEQLKDL